MAASGAPEYQTYVVRKGDSLWRIAEEQLGDPNRFADIAELNDGRRMPDGTVFSYAEFLQAGWVLIMPPDMGRHRLGLPGEAGRPLALAAGSAGPASTFATTRNDSGKTVAATGGLLAAGVLSALGDRRLHRTMRRRPGEKIAMRRPGEWELELSRIDNPTGQVLVDAALRTLSARLTQADRGLPDISATVLKRHGLELHLARPQPPVAPFYADPRRPGVWICPLGASIAAPPGPRPAPYPALVTMGFDEDDDTVLVDLEATGGVSLLAPEADAVSVLRAMAMELATGMAAKQLEVTLVGFGAELPPLFAPGTLTYGEDLGRAVDELARWSAGVEAVLDRRGVTVRKARTHPDEELAPITKTHVLLSAAAPDPRQTHRLRHLLSGRQRTSVAVVALASEREHALSPWTISAPLLQTPRSRSGTPGIGLRVQALREERYAAVVRELGAAGSEAVGGAGPEQSAGWRAGGAAAGVGSGGKSPLPKRIPARPQRWAGSGGGSQGGVSPSGASPSGAVSRVELIATPDPLRPNRFRAPVDDLLRVDALLPTALPTTTAPLPMPGAAKAVRLALKPANLPQFDPVADGDEEPPPPRPEDRLAEDRLVEVEAVFSAGRAEPAPRKPGQWQGAYWSQRKAAAAGMPKPAGVSDAAAVRTAAVAIDVLGPIVLAGAERSADAADLAEVAAYVMLHPGCPVQQLAEELWPADPGAMAIVDAQLVRLREVLGADALRITPESVTLSPSASCDWLEFLRRAQNGELVGALSLVRGRPFEDAPLRRYGWAETLRHEMAALAIDTAHYVAEACLQEQSPRNARKAALRGLAAAPESELLYRDLLTALTALGDHPAARRHADALRAYAEREGLRLQPETVAVLRDVAQGGAEA